MKIFMYYRTFSSQTYPTPYPTENKARDAMLKDYVFFKNEHPTTLVTDEFTDNQFEVSFQSDGKFKICTGLIIPFELESVKLIVPSKWVVGSDGKTRCMHCGGFAPLNVSSEQGITKTSVLMTKFCPHCGATMTNSTFGEEDA